MSLQYLQEKIPSVMSVLVNISVAGKAGMRSSGMACS